MRRWNRLVMALLLALAAPVVGTTGAYAGEGDVLENGGVIILRADYSFYVRSSATGCKTLVIVTTSYDLGNASAELESANEQTVVRIKDTGLDLRLRVLDGERMIGRVVGSGRPVMVVTREYAERHFL